MKNRKFRIVSIILACLLLIGGTIGISVSATETDEPLNIIAKKNVAYEGALKILYTIDPDTYDAETQTVKIEFTVGDETYTKELSEDVKELDGKAYGIIYSNGIAPKNARQPISAKPVIVDKASGETVAVGATEEYSVWQYAINRFAKDPTPDQKELYTALLDYCGSLQRLFYASGEYTENALAMAGGFADEYYVFNLYTLVDGATVDTETKTLSAKDLMQGYTGAGLDLDLPKTLNGALFDGFTDGEGNKLGAYGAEKTASSWSYLPSSVLEGLIKDIGTFDVYANYNTDAGRLMTYASGLDSNVTIGANTSIPEDEERLYYHRLSTANIGTTTFNNLNETGDVYVFETDITWLGYNTEGQTSTEWFMKIVIESDASKATSGDNMLARFFLNTTADDRMIIRTDKHGSYNSVNIASVAKGDTVNFRIEYIPTGTDASGNYTHTIRSYINGELKCEWVNDTTYGANYDNTTFNSIAFEPRGTGYYKAGFDFAMDNTVITTLNTVDSYDFEDGNATTTGFTLDTNNATANYSVIDDPLHTDVETAASKVLKAEVVNNNEGYDINTIMLTNPGSATGAGVYELSLDFYFDGLIPQNANKHLMDFIPCTGGNYFQLIYLVLETDGQLTIRTDMANSSSSLGEGKGATIATNIDWVTDGWNSIKFVMEKNGSDTYITVYLNDNQIGERTNTYHNTTTATTANIVDKVTWRIRNFITANDDGSYENTYDLYVDNIVYKYVGSLAQ